MLLSIEQEQGSRKHSNVQTEAELMQDDSGWSEKRKTRYINYFTVTMTNALIFYVLGSRGYIIVRDTIADG